MIPLFRPSCTDLEVQYVTDALRSGWWGLGPRVAEFEQRFAERTGVAHAVAVNSCTAALQLALEAAGVEGGEVIVPALTFASTALAVIHAGARPVYADVDDDTLCLDWSDAASKWTQKTRAVVPVWYGGTVAVPPPLISDRALAGAVIVEDAAHAAGSPLAGHVGDMACWSFHAVKNLATGDGGMITTGSADLAARLREDRWCGISKSTWDRDRGSYGWEYDIARPGHKAHMNDLTAALGLAQLERLDHMNGRRRWIALSYDAALSGLSWLRVPSFRNRTSWHLFAVRVEPALRDKLVVHLLSLDVSAGVHYKPLTSYPALCPEPVSLPVTDRAWRELVTLPMFPDMTEAEIAQVADAVKAFRP